MKKVVMLLFLSDAHLGLKLKSDQSPAKQRLFDCLEKYEDRLEKLFILGDLFDFWFEWKHVILKQHVEVLCRLKSLTQRGIDLHYLAGNHDFTLSRFLSEEIGANVHLDHYAFSYREKKFYLLHGDGLAPADWGYRILKRILRSPLNQKFYSWLHPDLALYLAHRSSSTSRNHTSRRWDVDGEAYRRAAREKIQEGFNYVLFAHTHEPLLEKVEQGIYINTGDWMKYFSYAVYDDGGMTLKYWNQPILQRREADALRTV